MSSAPLVVGVPTCSATAYIVPIPIFVSGNTWASSWDPRAAHTHTADRPVLRSNCVSVKSTRSRSSGSSPTRAQALSHVLAMSRQCAIFCAFFIRRRLHSPSVSSKWYQHQCCVSCHMDPPMALSPPPPFSPLVHAASVATFAMRIGNWRSKVDPHRSRILGAGSASARLAEERDATRQLDWGAVGIAK